MVHTRRRPRGTATGPSVAMSVLEGVLDLLAGVLQVGLALVGLALGFGVPATGHLAQRFLGLATEIVDGGLHLVGATHERRPFVFADTKVLPAGNVGQTEIQATRVMVTATWRSVV